MLGFVFAVTALTGVALGLVIVMAGIGVYAFGERGTTPTEQLLREGVEVHARLGADAGSHERTSRAYFIEYAGGSLRRQLSAAAFDAARKVPHEDKTIRLVLLADAKAPWIHFVVPK